MPEPTSPEEIEFRTEEVRLMDLCNYFPEPVTFELKSGGAAGLRVRLRRALRNYIENPSWTSSLDRTKAFKVLTTYNFVADNTTSLYCGLPRRNRALTFQPLPLEFPTIRTEDPEVIRAILFLKNLDHIPIPIKIETSLPVHELKQSYYNTEIADSIHENHYTIV